MADDRITTALQALLDWGRDHTSPHDPNSPHALLIEAKAALEAAGKIEPDIVELVATVRIKVARDAADDWIEERTIYDMLDGGGAEIDGPKLAEPVAEPRAWEPTDLRGLPTIQHRWNIGISPREGGGFNYELPGCEGFATNRVELGRVIGKMIYSYLPKER